MEFSPRNGVIWNYACIMPHYVDDDESFYDVIMENNCVERGCRFGKTA